jgi:hypothetical protein
MGASGETMRTSQLQSIQVIFMVMSFVVTIYGNLVEDLKSTIRFIQPICIFFIHL